MGDNMNRGRGRGRGRGQQNSQQAVGGRGRGVQQPYPPQQSAGMQRPQYSQVSQPVPQSQLAPAMPTGGPSASTGPRNDASTGPSTGPRNDASAGPSTGPRNDASAGPSTGRNAAPGTISGRGATRYTYLVTRPDSSKNSKKGSHGTPVTLQANYFKLITRPKWTLYQYRVDFSPEEERAAVKKSMLREHREKFGGYLFDGTVLYTPHRISPDTLTLHSRRREDEQTFAITIKLVGDLGVGDYAYFQVFNLLMRHCYSALNLQMLGRDFFDREGKVDIRDYRLQIWPGYRTTIAQYEDSIMMVAEITHKVLRLDTVLDLLYETQSNNRGNYRNAFNSEIIGQIVLTDYNNKTYRINDVNWKLNPLSTFPMNGENITYVDYYRQKYQITIRDMTQPLLVSLAKKSDIRRGLSELVLLVPELCRMTGITDKMRDNFNLMRSIADYTRVAPDARINKLLQFNRRLLTTREAVTDLKQWEMQLAPNLVEIPARQLPQETMFQGQKMEVTYASGDTNDGWTRNLRSNRLITVVPVQNWAVIVPQRILRDAQNFVRMIIQTGEAMGFKLPPPEFHDIQNDSVGIYLNKIEEVVSTRNPKFLLCVLMSSKPDLYNSIKRKCSVDRPIVSQVITGRSMNNKNNMSIATKVGIQINCKLGGCPWGVSLPVKKLMVIGYDVCHGSKREQHSYGAMVASLDRNYSKYFSQVSKHTTGGELAVEFSIGIKNALAKFSSMNDGLPNTILIYRDGVGEGQLPYVYNTEVKTIKDTLDEVYGADPYKFGFIVVSKRLNTRFFHKGQNPKPGTVVDDVVTSPERYDFFLISQAVRNGTVSPTSYNVLYDKTCLTPDQLQRVTYKLCHLYYNFSGQVRVPAPCQYAHKLAFLAGQSLLKSPHPALNSLLHFL